MRDRTIDINTTNYGRFESVVLRREVQYSTNSLVSFAEKMVRKRIPVGGKAVPEVEKPFYHSTLTLQYPRGKFTTGLSGIYRHVWSGVFNGQFAAYPGTANCDLSWPHSGAPQISATQVPGFNPDLLSQAEVRAMNKLRDTSGQSDFDVGMFFMERKETAEMFKSAATGLKDLAQAIARKDFRKSAEVLRDAFSVSATEASERARQKRLERWLRKELKRAPKVTERTARSISDLILGWNLGLSPLLKDLDSAYLRLLTGDLTVKTEVKSHGQVTRILNDRQVTNLGQGGSQTTTISEVKKHVVTLKAVPRHSVRAKLSAAGLGSAPRLIWNASSLTFIVDYFLAMGPFLASLDIPLEFEFKDGSRSLRVRRVLTTTLASHSGTMTGGYALVHFERKVYGSFPVPIPPLSLKGKDLSVKQAINTGLIASKFFAALVGR